MVELHQGPKARRPSASMPGSANWSLQKQEFDQDLAWLETGQIPLDLRAGQSAHAVQLPSEVADYTRSAPVRNHRTMGFRGWSSKGWGNDSASLRPAACIPDGVPVTMEIPLIDGVGPRDPVGPVGIQCLSRFRASVRDCAHRRDPASVQEKSMTEPLVANTPRPAASTGVPGLDDILTGGLTRRRLFLVEGVPGSGKTTLALQYLQAGARNGESVLYVTLSETEEELRAVAESHGWALEGVEIRELTPPEGVLDRDEQNTLFDPSEIELASTTKLILDDVERLRPARVVFDSLSELRLLAGSALRYRRQILALKQFFATRDCTVILLDDLTATDRDLQVQSIAHGVILLEQLNPDFGAERRRLRVVKYRGVRFRGGYHDYVINRGGIEVFPRLVAAEHRQLTTQTKLPSDIPELDALLGGGLEQGTSTLIVGAAGTGKSTLAAQFASAAARREQHAALFVFDESPATLLTRCSQLSVDLSSGIEVGHISLQQIDPAELTPGEFTQAIRIAVEQRDAKVVVIDSLNGFLNAMPGERHLTIHLHELLTYLGQKGVATILVSAHHGLVGGLMVTPVDASYLADAVILLRYFEDRGEVRQAVSVMKKRGSKHERTLREFRLDGGRIVVGKILREFRGVLTGVPIYDGSLTSRQDEEGP
jgi:circadian clock protein KaiC